MRFRRCLQSETLWDSANKLRGSVEAAEYKHVVLSLIFLKFASDNFVERREAIIAEGQDAFIPREDAKRILREKTKWHQGLAEI